MVVVVVAVVVVVVVVAVAVVVAAAAAAAVVVVAEATIRLFAPTSDILLPLRLLQLRHYYSWQPLWQSPKL